MPGGDRRVAIHEASHAVAGLALGLSVASVKLHSALTEVIIAPEPLKGLYWRLAGPAGEYIAFGRVDEVGARDDRVNAHRDAFSATRTLDGADALVADAWDPTVLLLVARWPTVERYADALVDGTGWLLAHDLERLGHPTPYTFPLHLSELRTK